MEASSGRIRLNQRDAELLWTTLFQARDRLIDDKVAGLVDARVANRRSRRLARIMDEIARLREEKGWYDRTEDS